MRAVEVIEHANARDFIECVVHTQSDGFVYRGHSDADFELVPKIARPENLGMLLKKPGAKPRYSNSLGDVYDRVTAYENFLMKMFYQQASAAGMPMPPVAEWVHQSLSKVSDSVLSPPPSMFSTASPARDLWPPLAWMQHLGIETRLLDWTSRPLSAVFFASLSRSPGEYIAVWALPLNILS